MDLSFLSFDEISKFDVNFIDAFCQKNMISLEEILLFVWYKNHIFNSKITKFENDNSNSDFYP